MDYATQEEERAATIKLLDKLENQEFVLKELLKEVQSQKRAKQKTLDSINKALGKKPKER